MLLTLLMVLTGNSVPALLSVVDWELSSPPYPDQTVCCSAVWYCMKVLFGNPVPLFSSCQQTSLGEQACALGTQFLVGDKFSLLQISWSDCMDCDLWCPTLFLRKLISSLATCTSRQSLGELSSHPAPFDQPFPPAGRTELCTHNSLILDSLFLWEPGSPAAN